MISLAIALLACGATIAIHSDDARNMPRSRVSALLNELAAAVARCGALPRVDPFNPSEGCARPDRCAAEIFAATRADEILFLRIFSVPSRIRVVAELRGRDETHRESQIDLSPTPPLWGPSLDQLARALFPAPSLEPAAARVMGGHRGAEVLPPIAPVPLGSPTAGTLDADPDRDLPAASSVPWWLIGSGAVAGGLALALGSENRNASREGRQPGLPPARVTELENTTLITGLGADVLFAVAATGLVTGALLLLTEW